MGRTHPSSSHSVRAPGPTRVQGASGACAFLSHVRLGSVPSKAKDIPATAHHCTHLHGDPTVSVWQRQLGVSKPEGRAHAALVTGRLQHTTHLDSLPSACCDHTEHTDLMATRSVWYLAGCPPSGTHGTVGTTPWDQRKAKT